MPSLKSSSLEEKKNFLIYTTANETAYAVDYANILAMTKLHPGVDKLHLVIVISEVQPVRLMDKVSLFSIRKMIDKCEWIDLREIIFKSNVGRDFSSAQIGLLEVAKSASDKDDVMIRNRSAYGPFIEGWFTKYTSLLDLNKGVGMVGNTINQGGHPGSVYEEGGITCHIQTYIYVSQFSVLKNIKDQFPGVDETDRLELINRGELQLSRELINKGYYLTCLLWPTHLFGIGALSHPDLPQKDVKNQILGLPFEHRHSKIKYPLKRVRGQWKWVLFCNFIWVKFLRPLMGHR